MPNILLIDDDAMINRVVDRILRLDGYKITTMTKFTTEVINQLFLYDLILLDIMMPEVDGFDVLRQIRDETSVPIIFITAKVQEADVLLGLGLGADDYIKKPFSPEELKARIQAHLRREHREQKTLISKGEFRFDIKAMKLFFGSDSINLTKGEYQICEYLARYEGQVFTKEQIFEEVFGFDKESNESTIATHIKNIRGKISEFTTYPIQTVWGIGYKWELKNKEDNVKEADYQKLYYIWNQYGICFSSTNNYADYDWK